MKASARVLLVAVIMVASWIGIRPARCEVGVFVDPADNQLRPKGGAYDFALIVEDPDGFPVWTSFTPDARRIVLNAQGDANGDGPPSTLLSASGVPVVAWARNSPSGYDVVISTYPGGGAWSEPEVVAGGPDDEMDPSLVLDPSSGAVHLFYWVDATVPVVMHREAPADLSSWSAPDQVSGGVYPAYRPWGVFHEGVLRVIYEVHNYGSGQTPRQIVLARQENGSFVPEIMAVSYYSGLLWPRVHSTSGRLWIDWIDAQGEIAWFRLDPGGSTWEPTHYEPFASAEEMEFHVRPGIRLKVVEMP